MFFSRKAPLIVGLDIGTSAIKIAVAERRDDGTLVLLGAHQVESRGMQKGEVVDHAAASDAIYRAIHETEELLNMTIGQVELSLTGGHVDSANHRGTVTIRNETGQIEEADVEDAVNAARASISLPEDRVVLHVIRQQFYIDGKDGVANPIGLVGGRLEADTHLIHGIGTRFQNMLQCLHSRQETSVEVGSYVFSGLASALAVLGRHEKEMGAILLDIGAGTTEYVVYNQGMVRQTGVLAVGGDHLVNDLLLGLKLNSRRQAESLIHMHGSVWPDESIRGKMVTVKTSDLISERERVIPLQHIQTILYHRMDEILRIIHGRLRARESLDLVGGGVYLTGGCVRMPSLAKLTESIFKMPTVVAKPQGFDGLFERAAQPEMSTALGLIRYGYAKGGMSESGTTVVKSPMARLVSWLKNGP
jgi:cell division protein FtsA